MAYSPTYESDDLSPIVIDVGSKVLVQIGAFAAIFGLILGWVILVLLLKRSRRK